MHLTTKDDLIQYGLQICRAAGDLDELLLTARDLRYWARRLELADPGPIDEELALIDEPDIEALRCAIRQAWHLLRAPLGDWRRKGKILLAEVDSRPVLAHLGAQARVFLRNPRPDPPQLISRWGPRESRSPALYRELYGHKDAVTACAMPSGSPLLVTVDETEVLVWDVPSGTLCAIHSDGDHAETLDACAPRSGAWLGTVQVRGGRVGLIVSNPAALKIWDVRGGGPPRILTSTEGGPYACELSPDERWLISYHLDRKAYFWDTGTWELAGVINGESDPDPDAAADGPGSWAYTCYAADASWFALANPDGTIGLWDPATRTLRQRLAGHRSCVAKMVAPRDASWLASTNGRELCIWDPRDGALLQRTGASATGCAGLLADPAGRWVAACFGTDSVGIIPVTGQSRRDAIRRAGQRLGHFRRLAGRRLTGPWVTAGARCATGEDGSKIVSVSAVEAASHGGNMISQRYLVSCWDPATGARIAGPTSRPGKLPSVIMSHDHQRVTIVGEERVEIFDPETADILTEFTDPVRAGAAGRGLLAIGFGSGVVRLFRPSASEHTVRVEEQAPAGLEGCFAAPHGRWIMAWSRREITVLDRPTGAVRAWLEGKQTGVFLNKRINACCFSPDGSWVATADDNGTVRVWSPDTGRQRTKAAGGNGEDFITGRCASTRWMATIDLEGRLFIRDRLGVRRHELHQASWPKRACASGDSWLAVEDETGTRLWDPIAGAHIGDLPGEYGAAPITPGPTGTHTLVATIGASGDVKIRDPFTGLLHATFGAAAGSDAQSDHTRVRAVHPAGDWLVVSDNHGMLTVWLVRNGERKQLSRGYGEPIMACSVAPNGSMLATVRHSGVLHVWDSATWQQITTTRTDGPLTDCCWSPAGDQIYAVGARGAYCFDALQPGS